MQITDLKNQGLIILEAISGSKAYGLDTPSSDTDIKGIFLLPKKDYYSLDYVSQVNNETNDLVYYELSRFLKLLSVNNPNILELLNSPEDTIMYKHPFLDKIKPEMFLSKLCKETFGQFAYSQIRKAKGLNKKIVNPISKERKSLLFFCYVNYKQGSITLLDFLELKGWKAEHCGLVNISHMRNVFGLYYGENKGYNGIIRTSQSNDICLSSINKGEEQEALLYFNQEGYSTYCKEYSEYWEWVEKRNEARYENTKKNGKNYDAKNMMHTFRLLEMAIEIGKEGKINVRRKNRDFLLGIKNGNYEYEDLLLMAEEKRQEMEIVFEKSSLPDKPDLTEINKLAYELRDLFYS